MDEPLDIRWHRLLPNGSKPSSVTISKDGANRYLISILVEEEIKPLPVTPQMVGLDLGIKSMVALSTGESVGNPRYFANEEKKLAKAKIRILYPSLRAVLGKVKIERMGSLPPRLISPLSMKPLDLKIQSHLGPFVASKG
jgi:hypothetical protein